MLPLRTYTPEPPLRDPVRFVMGMFADVPLASALAWRLAVRDVSAQYRQAALGLLWVLILPVSNALIWLFLRHAGLISIGDPGMSYAAYVLTGTILWAILTDAVNAPLQQTAAARSMLVKIDFPREALVLSGIYQSLFNGVIRIAVVLVALAFMGVHAGWSVLYAVGALLSLIVAGTAVGLCLTPLGLLYTDIGKGLPLLMQLLMYLAPVLYPAPRDGAAAVVLGWNPFTPLILTGRAWLTGAETGLLPQFLCVNLGFLLLLIFVVIVYRLAMPRLIERMGT